MISELWVSYYFCVYQQYLNGGGKSFYKQIYPFNCCNGFICFPMVFMDTAHKAVTINICDGEP